MARIAYVPFDSLAVKPLPIWKRLEDITISLVLLLLASPLFAATALFIKLVSPGPVFYKSQRIGYGGRPFTMWKFRSMHVRGDADNHKEYMARLIREGGSRSNCDRPSMVKLDRDPRLIPMAAIIRKTCLDELPQLINVLRGEMSLVGPRPAVSYEAEEYEVWHRGRLEAVPGMTGLWQVSGKNNLTFLEMVALDIRYSREMSPWLDFKILVLTMPAILMQIGEHLAGRKDTHV